jgi:arylsulfatase A
MMLTHGPFQPTPDSADWDPQARGEKANRDDKHFADMTAYMDKLIGKLVAKLDELGIRDNTLIIFLGDNGTAKGLSSQFKGQPYQGGKGLTNARGTHVPLIVNWPDHVPAEKVNGDLIDNTDFLPTICAAAGVEVPESLEIDGQSFWPQLQGQPGKPREWRYVWYSKDVGPTATFEFAMCKTYKLYRNDRLYNLETDPFEERAIAEADRTPEDVAAAKMLRGAMEKYTDARPERLKVAVAPRSKRRRAVSN